jgi:hypothetical protein
VTGDRSGRREPVVVTASALKAQNSTAQGDALGTGLGEKLRGLKARDGRPSIEDRGLSARIFWIPSLRGRCPGLWKSAPLVLVEPGHLQAVMVEGYFETPSAKGPLRPAFPAKVQEFYFPQLFLDLPVETQN